MTRHRLSIEMMGEWPSTWDLQDNPSEALYGEGGKEWSDEREDLLDELAGIDVVADTVVKLVQEVRWEYDLPLEGSTE